MTQFPLRYAHRNILFGRGDERTALYWLPTVSYRHLTEEAKTAEASRLATLAYAARADFALWRVCRQYPVESYAEQAEPLLDARETDPTRWYDWLDAHTVRLDAMRSYNPEVYFAVGVGGAGLGGGFGATIDRARRRIEDLVGVGRAQPVPDSDLVALEAKEEEVYNRILNGMPEAMRASDEDLQWLLRRAAVRGITEPLMDTYWRPNALTVDEGARVLYHPLEASFVRHANAAITEHIRHLEIDAEEGRTHQAILTLGTFPDDAEFPGRSSELLFAPLELCPFPVDACLHGRWIPNKQALTMVRNRKLEVENAFKEQMQSATGAGLLTESDRDLAANLEAYLQGEGNPPMLMVTISLAVSAYTQEELDARVTVLRENYGQVQLHQPSGMQEDLYYLHLPQPARTVKDYVEPITIEQFGALMPIGDNRVGSVDGAYIGYTLGGGRRPVKWNPLEASEDNRPSAILMAGTLGSGKTLAAQLLAMTAAYRGSQVIDVDPKGDHRMHTWPGLTDRARLLALSGAEEYAGALDPMRVSDPEHREGTAMDYYLDVLREPDREGLQTALAAAVRTVSKRGDATSLDVVAELREKGHDEVADALEVAGDFDLARLAFGSGTATTNDSAPLTTVRANGLQLPSVSSTRENYSYAEKLAVATLGLLANYALALVKGDVSRHKIILFDEAWFLLASSQGRTLLDRLVRLGRAQNATVIIATQQLGDLGPLVDLIGTIFLFGQNSKNGAVEGLKLLGLDHEDPGLIQQVTGMRDGRGLMKDLNGRVAEIQIDFEWNMDLLRHLDTSPQRQRRTADPEDEPEAPDAGLIPADYGGTPA